MSTKTALVWGANGSIGQALVSDFAAQGWQVIAVSRDGQDVPGAVVTIQADVTNERAVEAAVMAAAHEADNVALFIYAAGDIIAERVDVLSPADWQRIVGANLDGAYLTTHFSLPLLTEDAQLVYLGAVSERLRLPGLAAYAAAKAGLEAFAEALRKEERKRRVLVVRPGAVSTSFWDKVPMRLPKDAATPQKVSGRIMEACAEQLTGTLDLT
jgi:NAD(P)-dependent dehydrogenase (short-subunit alcohol dehydrogenase family)